jgi:hypothetical protein
VPAQSIALGQSSIAQSKAVNDVPMANPSQAPSMPANSIVMPGAQPVNTQASTTPLAAPVRPPFKAPAKAPEVEQEEPQGLDTTGPGETQGNWLFKRMWWQRGQTQYEKIKGAVESIMESRMAFFAKRTEWDKTIFDPFYQDSGLARGVLVELIGSLISQLDQERTREGQLDEKERDLLGALESQKELLEQLQKDVQKINDIDNAVDEAISVLIRQINVARNFEKQAWQNFKAIAQELNDKKARELYYGMVTYWQNINDIGQYIQMPFLQHFEKLGVMAKDQTAKVLDALKALKEKGIDFKKQWQQLEENNARQHLAHDHKENVEQEKKEDEMQKHSEQGFFAKILGAVVDAATTTWSYIQSAGQTLWDFTVGRFFAKKAENIEQSAHESAVAAHEEISPAVHEKQEHTDDQHDEQMNEPSTEHNG